MIYLSIKIYIDIHKHIYIHIRISHLAVGDGLLGQVVEDDERVHAVVAEVLADGAAGVGRKELRGQGVCTLETVAFAF